MYLLFCYGFIWRGWRSWRNLGLPEAMLKSNDRLPSYRFSEHDWEEKNVRHFKTLLYVKTDQRSADKI